MTIHSQQNRVQFLAGFQLMTRVPEADAGLFEKVFGRKTAGEDPNKLIGNLLQLTVDVFKAHRKSQ